MKRIININTPEIPCPGTHRYTATKLCRGFQQRGFEFIELNSLDGIEKYNDKDTIFLLSDHFNYIKTQNKVYEIGKKLENSFFIAWHFNFYPDLVNNMPFKKYIITGEWYVDPPKSSVMHQMAYNISMSSPNWVPFVFSSSINPDDVGLLERGSVYDACFVGSPYKINWINSLNGTLYVNTTNSLPEEQRVRVYLDSRICLGFHNDSNIANNCVVERVFEGLSYGCAVISDNPAAEKITGGIVKYAPDIDSLLKHINYFKDEEIYKRHQKMGYELVKKSGTYYGLSGTFIEKFNLMYA
jgi:hypothetical protein